MAVKTGTVSLSPPKTRPKLKIVLKCDSVGSIEAVTKTILATTVADTDIVIIRSGPGDINRSDVLLAETASRLIVGFQVEVSPGVERLVREHHVEVRLYKVIYTLIEEIKKVAENLIAPEEGEQIIGTAEVIAIFKGPRRGIILGCEVKKGFLATGHHFRVISAMGPVYSGVIESLHIGQSTVQKAAAGQHAGLKIKNFNKAKVGDVVESFRPQTARKASKWEPAGAVLRR